MSNANFLQAQTFSVHKDIFKRNHVNELVNMVKSFVENGVASLSIDFNEIENIDIIGFGVLRTVQKISITNNIEIKLFNVKDNVKKILENSCLIMDIQDDKERENLIHEEIALIA